MSRRRLALVFGGRSPEHDVSLVSARAIHDQLDRDHFELLLVGVDRQGRPRLGGRELLAGGLDRGEGIRVRWPASPTDRALREEATGRLVSAPLDVVFPIIHGAGGEDGALQGMLQLCDIPCVGAGVLGSALAMDKDRTRRMLAAEGIPVVEDIVLHARARRENPDAAGWRARVHSLGYPVFVKPARTGSSVGITKVTAAEQLDEALEIAERFDEKIVIERAVPAAREIEISVLGLDRPEVSVPGEIVPAAEFYDYRAKYEDPESKLLIPAPIDEALVGRIGEWAKRAFVALDLAGMARVDFLLSRESGETVLNEVNTLPGFTPISMYPKLWQASGLTYPRLLDRLVELAFEAARPS
ncbi:MAG: D-alanine--D-alanine ligase [Acidobacteriota bacterium]|nr:MAG: D-alanine--D-alanine ligase [Acidobacteriota bacterium]